jgi:hypothetical protein|tara:strand:- start:173 stop:562 length:390 start_codon:yes stop_codon:yes gene_type:complete
LARVVQNIWFNLEKSFFKEFNRAYRMANSIKFLIIASFCASCGTVSSVDSFGVFGPNGQEAYSMQCSGMGATLDDCFQRAEELCEGDDYEILDSWLRDPIHPPPSVMTSPAETAAKARTSHIMIECKEV